MTKDEKIILNNALALFEEMNSSYGYLDLWHFENSELIDQTIMELKSLLENAEWEDEQA